MSHYPKISIVTPSFNQGQYIEQTILSVINQKYPNLEYIIIDGGSSDNTVDIIKKYEPYITYWVSEKDNGQSDALNKGLGKCTGEIFNWINSDDYLEENALFEIANAFNDKNTDIACGYSRIFTDKDNKTVQAHRSELFPTVEQTMVEQRINQPAMFYRKEIIDSLGGINTNLHYTMDLELWWRYLASFGLPRIKLSDKVLAHFRIHDHSKTGVHEQRFRDEEASIWHHLLKQLGFSRSWVDYFGINSIYKGPHWNIASLDIKELKTQLARKYLYPAFAKGQKKFCREAFWQLAKNGSLSISFQTVALFVKLYIGNLSMRKYIKSNA